MKRRGFLKALAGLCAAPALAPLAKAIEEEPQRVKQTTRNLKRYVLLDNEGTTLSCVVYDTFREPLFLPGERVNIGEENFTIGKVYEHKNGERS